MNLMTQRTRRFVMVRAELGVDQKTLAQEARVSTALISKIEQGLPIREATALQVFYAVNRLRKERGFPELSFDEIEWTLT